MLSSCLAHVINLATQAFISAYSKAPHFDPQNPDNHIPDTNNGAGLRDEVGLVRAICVKVRTVLVIESSKSLTFDNSEFK